MTPIQKHRLAWEKILVSMEAAGIEPTAQDRGRFIEPERPKVPMPENVKQQLGEMRAMVNEDSILRSLLYDLDLMPEQLDFDRPDWRCRQFVLILLHWRMAKGKQAEKPTAQDISTLIEAAYNLHKFRVDFHFEMAKVFGEQHGIDRAPFSGIPDAERALALARSLLAVHGYEVTT